MGKLELSHFTDKPAKKPSRRSGQKREEAAATAQRFGSLVEGNPFKIAGEESRRNRRRNPRTRGNVKENTNSKTNSPLLRSEHRLSSLPDNQIVSRRLRNTIPDLKIDEESVFPELASSTNANDSDTLVAAKDTPTSASQATSNTWTRSGKDVITSATSSKVKSPTDSVSLGPVRPGWVRLSVSGCEYGPRSENYERLLELQQQTIQFIHREFFAKTARMMNDSYEIDRCEGSFFSDDEGMSDCDDVDYDARNNSDDDDDSEDDY